MRANERRHHRSQASFPVGVRTGGVCHSSLALDLSLGGMGVSVSQPLDPQSVVCVHLELPTGSGEGPIDMLGRVVWVADGKVGLRFESTDRRLAQALEHLKG